MADKHIIISFYGTYHAHILYIFYGEAGCIPLLFPDVKVRDIYGDFKWSSYFISSPQNPLTPVV